MKVLLLDLETSFLKGAVWGVWKQNVNWAGLDIKDKFLLSWAAKWLNDDYIYSDALYRHKKVYRSDPTDDSAICATLGELLEEADVVVAHNGDRFDIKRLKTRFLLNGMPPPSPFLTIDTLKIAKREFAFASNRLDHLGELLGVGRKIKTDFELWTNVVDKHDVKAFEEMVAYNEQDVLLLEDVYLKLRPYNTKAFNMTRDGVPACNSCGDRGLQRYGWRHTPTGKYQKFKCTNCGHVQRSRYQEKETSEAKHSIHRSC